MNSLIRKLALPVGAAMLAGTGFAYLSGGTSSASYASQSASAIGSYASYNVRYTIGDVPGTIGYVHFDAVPSDNSHAEQADASTAMIQFVGGGTNTWVTCERSTGLGFSNSLSRNLTAVNTAVVVSVSSPESSWMCYVRAT